LAHSEKPGLRLGVSRPRKRTHATARPVAELDQHTFPSRTTHGDDGRTGVKGTLQVGRYDIAGFVGLQVREPAPVEIIAGRAYIDIDPPIRLGDSLNGMRGGTSIGNVAKDRLAVATSRTNACHRFAQRSGAAAAY